MCHLPELSSHLKTHTKYLIFAEKSTAVRLRGRQGRRDEGRLEIFYDGQWGTICNNGWDMNNTRVACHQLGYRYGVRVLQSWQVEQGPFRIWLDDLACTGSEDSLAMCPHKGWGSHTCHFFQNVGIECSSTGKASIGL